MKIRILHIVETIGSGGVEQTRLLLARYLDKSVFEQKIVCTQTIGPLADDIRAAGVEVIPIGIFKSILSVGHYSKIIGIIKRYRPHIIHGGVFEGVTMATISGFLGRVPVVIAEETSDPQNRTWKGHLLLQGLTTLADYVVAISPAVEKYLIANGISRRKVRLINNGVDIPDVVSQESIESARLELGIGHGDYIVGTVGRLLNSHKRYSDLIEAISVLKHQIPVKLLIVGDGQDMEMLRQLARDKQIDDRIIFAGYQHKTAPYFKCMNIFALASHREGFGLVLVEAMLHKLPVIATNVGGIPDVLQNGETGILVNSHSPESFAENIKKLYSDKQLSRAFSEKGYSRAMNQYTSSVYVKNIEHLYSKAMEKVKSKI